MAKYGKNNTEYGPKPSSHLCLALREVEKRPNNARISANNGKKRLFNRRKRSF